MLTWSPCLDTTVPPGTWSSATRPSSREGSYDRNTVSAQGPGGRGEAEAAPGSPRSHRCGGLGAPPSGMASRGPGTLPPAHGSGSISPGHTGRQCDCAKSDEHPDTGSEGRRWPLSTSRIWAAARKVPGTQTCSVRPPERDPGRASMGGREPPRCCCAGTAAHRTAPGPAAEDDRERITTSWAAPARRQGCCHCRGSSVQGNHRGPLGLLPTVGAGEPPTAAGAAPTTVTLTRQMRFWAQTVKDVKSHRHTSKGHTALRVCLKTLHVLKENADDSANVA